MYAIRSYYGSNGADGNAGEGIRVTVINLETGNQAGNTVDFTNINWDLREQNPSAYVTGIIDKCSIGNNKLYYMNGGSYSNSSGEYDYWYKPSKPVPTVIV